MSKDILFCKSGGCSAKLGAGVLARILECLPKGRSNPNLLVGYDSHDDAAVYQVSDDLAIVQTLDFFPPMVEDPYIFGQIAAANALSDIFAMGADVTTALNIVCFPESYDLNILGKIMQGGSEKVIEAGGILVGGHSISDSDIKYGLSVNGIVHPKHIYTNNNIKTGDVLVLTKKLGVGIICSAQRVNGASEKAYNEAIASMTLLNKYAADISKHYDIHACTDITGFSFLGHLHEMLDHKNSCIIDSSKIPVFDEVMDYANEFYITGAAQKNRNQFEKYVCFKDIDFAMEEVLFDPQTSGGLLFALGEEEASQFVKELKDAGLPAGEVGKIIDLKEIEIYVE